MSKEEFKYIEKPIDKLKANFNERKRKDLNGFKDFDDFYNWFLNQKKTCFYCEIDEYIVQRIVIKSLLTSNRFPLNGMLKQGRSRGMWLEVDRLNPKNNYSRENCVLCCYFCNNDKSDVFDGLEYKKFFQNRKEYLTNLIHKHD